MLGTKTVCAGRSFHAGHAGERVGVHADHTSAHQPAQAGTEQGRAKLPATKGPRPATTMNRVSRGWARSSTTSPTAVAGRAAQETQSGRGAAPT